MDHETGIALYGSKNIYVRKRAKGTERSDLADQDEGVKMFFGDEPEMPMCYEPTNMDLAIMPCIDGWFKTEVKPMGQFEAAYQSYHSMMNFFGLNQLLCGKHGLVMPIVDTDERRQDRGAFCAKYAAGRPSPDHRTAVPDRCRPRSASGSSLPPPPYPLCTSHQTSGPVSPAL